MVTADVNERIVELRRDLHQHPEPAWREFYTTARLIQELERIGVDEYYLGEEALDMAWRWGVPKAASELESWAELAVADGASPDIVESLKAGTTGIVARLDCGDGPHVGLRVDIDALQRTESADPDHLPAAEGFRSTREGAMHACGHDAHASIGIGVIESVKDSDFSGTLTVCFQPAEEEIGGAKAMAEGGHFDAVDYFLAIHVGLDYPTGTVVAGFDGFLAVTNVTATFHGAGSHAGSRPELGRNAVQALATATTNLYGIARHHDGDTRLNVGRIEGGSASNIIPDTAQLFGEVRGETTALRDYMKDRANTIIESAAAMHDCTVDIEFGPEAPSGTSDRELVDIVGGVADEVPGVTEIISVGDFSGSEDATYLMEHVQENGGLATYIGIGTDHPGGHHSATFDVDEASLSIGVDVLTNTIRQLEINHPVQAD